MKLSINPTVVLTGALMFLSQVQAVCYNDTQAMLEAQMMGETKLEICAGTTMNIGLPLNAEFTQWSGMIPLAVIKDDVEIYCGADKKSSNQCVLNGGFLQLITTVVNPLLPTTLTTSTNNLQVTGLTFTGELVDFSIFVGNSISIGAPGTGIVFDDIILKDMKTSTGFILGRHPLVTEVQFPLASAFVSVKNSNFQNIIYSKEFIGNDGQILGIDNVQFDNVNYAPLCDCNTSSLMVLRGASRTILTNVSIDVAEVLTTVVFQRGEGTEFSQIGLTANEVTVYDKANRDNNTFCAKGHVIEKVVNGFFDECLDLVTAAPTEGPDDDSGARPSMQYSYLSSAASFLALVVVSNIG